MMATLFAMTVGSLLVYDRPVHQYVRVTLYAMGVFYLNSEIGIRYLEAL